MLTTFYTRGGVEVAALGVGVVEQNEAIGHRNVRRSRTGEPRRRWMIVGRQATLEPQERGPGDHYGTVLKDEKVRPVRVGRSSQRTLAESVLAGKSFEKHTKLSFFL